LFVLGVVGRVWVEAWKMRRAWKGSFLGTGMGAWYVSSLWYPSSRFKILVWDLGRVWWRGVIGKGTEKGLWIEEKAVVWERAKEEWYAGCAEGEEW
jgi:hypothetical protein